ncbi:MAG TPA: hypothetical protein PLE61_06665 [Vicinamibacterales bacterium]|nr:hypothetical protein [Vicinamibacterales bacterium]
MAEFVPVPIGRLLRRAHREYSRQGAVFGLPEQKFYRPPALRDADTAPGPSTLDLSVCVSGQRAGNPMGLAAGPHTQLAQNIVLGWLAGARVFELKTVQVNDRITVPRPCIDAATIGYNTEWSQELRLDESLREYVKASMLIEALEAMGILGRGIGLEGRESTGGPPPRATPVEGGVVFDASVGYDLEGIRSPAMASWLESIRSAGAIVDDLRREIAAAFPGLRDFPFKTRIAAGVTVSTFHHTPPGEIERIGEFLIGDLGFHTMIKVSPPMLGRERLEAILHGALGYEEVAVDPSVYERCLSFEEAAGIMRRLQPLAARRGVTAGVKCGNTLEVVGAATSLTARVQYLSGQPLHALHAALAAEWREAFGPDLPLAFAGGVDAGNAADCVAAGLAPVTVCTDLLRAGGYGRLPRYLVRLDTRMRAAGARTIPEFVARTAGEAGVRGDAVLRNARALAARALREPRYRADANRTPPRKLGTRLGFWDCLSCSKCVPVCPNGAVFELEVEPFAGEVPVLEVDTRGWRDIGRRCYRVAKARQIAVFADACNACGNCAVFCPEDGGPHLQKPLFFGSVESWLRAAPRAGFVLSREGAARVLRGRLPVGACALSFVPGSERASFEAPSARLSIAWASHAVLDAAPWPPWPSSSQSPAHDPHPQPVTVDLSAYLTLRLLLGALLNPARIHYVNAEFVE